MILGSQIFETGEIRKFCFGTDENATLYRTSNWARFNQSDLLLSRYSLCDIFDMTNRSRPGSFRPFTFDQKTVYFSRTTYSQKIHWKKIRIKFFIQKKNWYVQKRDFSPMTKFGFFVFSWIERLKQVKYMDIQLQWMSHKLWRHTVWRHLPWRHTWCRHPLWIWS